MIPTHIAFIMDGNRRWARAHGLPVFVGHKKGFDQLTDVVKHAQSLGVKHLTFWAFSTENWKRDAQELDGLMRIFRTAFTESSLKELIKAGAKVVIFGDISRFAEDIRKNLQILTERTKNNTSITINIALNYGGKAEILKAVNELLKENNGEVDEQAFSARLYSSGQPDPDLIIRTGGEKRLSGYLPWQTVYSELYFTDTYWPDFDVQALNAALEDFSHRQRRFGR